MTADDVTEPVPVAGPAADPGPAAVPRPDRALGRLGPALAWLAGAQGSWPPHQPRFVHRLTEDLAAEPPPSARLGTPAAGATPPGDAARTSPEQQARRDALLGAGTADADALADEGVDLVLLVATGDPVPGIVLSAALLQMEPVDAVGTASVDGQAAWAATTRAVRDGLRRARPHLDDPVALLAALGSPPLARLTGVLVQTAARRTPVLLDGSAAVCSAALLAERLAPGAKAWWSVAQAAANPAARRALERLGLTPLLDMGLPPAAGADLALVVLEHGVSLTQGAEPPEAGPPGTPPPPTR